MKLPLHLVLSSCIALPVVAYSWTTSSSSSSAFTGRRMTQRSAHFANDAMVMYESPRDPPDSGKGNMWAVLADTERWLSDTLAAQEGQSNPFTRKEVSYVCENSNEAAMITAAIFRRLREAREQGEHHGQAEEERLMEQGTSINYRM